MFSDREHTVTTSTPGSASLPAAKLAHRYNTAGKSVILYAGTFEAYQGLELLIEASPTVVRVRPPTMFLCVGGKASQVAALQRHASFHGVEHYFVFPGEVPPESVESHFAIADVLVSLRVSGTNTPLKIYSYLRSGVPIVATNVRSHTQVLTPEVALLVEPQPEAIAGGILRLLADQELARYLSANARKLAREAFSAEAYYAKVAEVYAFLEAKRPPSKT
jgi:glycosyltransferase involved in cell wall biosynthesis